MKKTPAIKPPKKRKTKDMTKREVEELMGVNRQTYVRNKGAIRQK
ncbi:hypothetical protein [Paenalkalicoccus suaedae]|nr:hypothetical protein [Paenalkalicoccus suaedae]